MGVDVKVFVDTKPPQHVAIINLPVGTDAASVVTVVPLGTVHNHLGVLGAAAVRQHVPRDTVVASRPDAEDAGAW